MKLLVMFDIAFPPEESGRASTYSMFCRTIGFDVRLRIVRVGEAILLFFLLRFFYKEPFGALRWKGIMIDILENGA